MKQIDQIESYIKQFKSVIFLHDDAYRFIKEHRLWEGFWRYGWAGKISIFLALILSVQLFYFVYEWFGRSTNDTIEVISSMGMFTSDLGGFFKGLFGSSATKYLLILFLEVIIFHFCIKSIGIIENKSFEPRLKDFIRAEVRMFKVVIRSWILEILLVFLVGIILDLVGLDFLGVIIAFFIRAYYLGFAFLDNYLEQYGYSIKESALTIKSYLGASIGLGLVSYVLIFIPVIGLIVAPLLGAVVSTLYLHANLPKTHSVTTSIETT